MNTLGKVLIVDDEIELKNILCETLSNQRFETAGFTNGKDALLALKNTEYDILLTDLMMPEMDGIELLKSALEVDPDIVVIIMTGQGTVETAVEAMKLGAFDFILKPFKLNILSPTVNRAIMLRNLKKENIELRDTVAMYELTKTISVTMDLNLVADKLAEAAMEQSKADEVSVMLPTGDGAELYVAAVRGKGKEAILGERVGVGHGIAGWVAQRKEMLTIEGQVNDPRFNPVHPRPDINSAVSLPMLAGGKFVGVLNINTTRRRSFTAGQVKALYITVSMAAPSLENAWLFRKVRSAEEKYRKIFENAVEGIFQSTPDGRFITVNPALVRMLGYDSSEELLTNITDIGHQVYANPGDRDAFISELEKTGEVRGFETRFRRKDGSVIWVSRSARKIHDEVDNSACYEGTVEDITTRKLAQDSLKQTLGQLRKTLDGIIEAMSFSIQTRDPYTAGHQKRVKKLANVIALRMGLPEHVRESISIASTLHDIGKIAVPAEILSKPTRLSRIEFDMVKTHPRASYDILKEIEFPWPLAEIVFQHHERLDGSGYPRGLKGDEILLEARVLAVADVVEAISSHRPYRPAHEIYAAVDEITKNKGTLYDPEIVDICIEILVKERFRFDDPGTQGE